MKKGWIILIVVAILIFFGYSWVKGSYNSMVTLSESVDKQWADVENAFVKVVNGIGPKGWVKVVEQILK